ncbi:hypothetical protein U879_01865 [Defluviimonas sp. 20V17]|nr:hypothetical protein U879_01865 [Defluviimonas sp. 20V17]
MRITAASLMRDMQGNAIRSEEDSCYQVFPFLIDHVRLRMIRSPRRHEHFIDRTKITFREALTEDGRRYIRHSSYPGLDDVLINAEPYTDPEFLREYAAYAFTAQLTQMSGHELAEFISSKSCDDE